MVSTPRSMSTTKAAQFVSDGLTACLPLGVPLSGQIIRAEFTGKQKAIAVLTMFDGQPGAVEVSKWGPFEDAWCIAWQDTGNAPCHWTGSAWERAAPRQLSLFDRDWPLSREV